MKNIINLIIPNQAEKATQRFFFAAVFWLLVGVILGLLSAIVMVDPEFLPPFAQLTFGRLRPTHTNMVIFGFLLNAYFGGLLYTVPTVCRTTLWAPRMANFAVWFYNATILIMLAAIAHGHTQGREYAEAPWIVDIMVLISVGVLILLVFMTIAHRKEKLLFVTVWYTAAGLIWTFFVYAVGNVVWEIPTGSWTGINDQILLWFYGHNVVGLVITPQAIALAYYIIPRATRSPLYSHTLSLFGFWALIVMYTHTGTHHLLQTPVPEWLKVLSIVNSVALIIPVFAFLTNIWLPLKERFDRIYANVGAKMVFTGSIWYFITCVQGPFQSLPSVQRVTHYTQWVIAHSHIALLGFGGFIAMGAIYFILPLVTKRSLYSQRLADYHYWLQLLGTIGIFLSLTFAGLIQGEGWLIGETVYRILAELKIYFVVRGISGVLVLVGILLFIYNVAMTILTKTNEQTEQEFSQETAPTNAKEVLA